MQLGAPTAFTALPGGQLVSNAYVDVDSTAQRLTVSVNATGGKFYEPAPGRTLVVRFALARGATDVP